MDELILVDELDKPIGKMDKQRVHEQGLLHRAFSVFLFNGKGELLLQQRAAHKYHSAGLWSNTCCSHPRFGETLENAVPRRMEEEMGMRCDSKFVFSFVYRADFDNGLTEHEFDHVYFAISDAEPRINKEEVGDYKYMSMDDLEKDIERNPDRYTAWFRICLPRVREQFNRIFIN